MPAPMSQASSATAAKSQKNNKQKGVGTIGSNPFSLILPIAYCLLPIAYCLLPQLSHRNKLPRRVIQHLQRARRDIEIRAVQRHSPLAFQHLNARECAQIGE
jgi:hypothetical protein